MWSMMVRCGKSRHGEIREQLLVIANITIRAKRSTRMRLSSPEGDQLQQFKKSSGQKKRGLPSVQPKIKTERDQNHDGEPDGNLIGHV